MRDCDGAAGGAAQVLAILAEQPLERSALADLAELAESPPSKQADSFGVLN